MKKGSFLLSVGLVTMMTFAAFASGDRSVPLLNAVGNFEALADENRRLPIDELRNALDPEFSRQIDVFSKDLVLLEDGEVRAYMSAAFTAAFYTKRLRYLHPQVEAFKVLEGRDAVVEDDVRRLQRGYILARDFEQAGALQRRYPSPELEVVPTLESAEAGITANAMTLTPENTLRPVEVDLASGDRLVALVHPGCAFSRQAVADVNRDRGAEFPVDMLWVLPFNPTLSADAIHDWQQPYRDLRFHIPIRFEDWSFLQSGEVPVFYRIRDGEVVDKVVGWPDEGNMAALRRLAES